MKGPRYSIIPAFFFEDSRLDKAHFRVMGTLGRHTNETGWCRLKQGTIAGEAGVARETVNRALSDLVTWGYVERREYPGYSHAYRVLMDSKSEPPSTACEVEITCDPEITGGCDGTSHTGCDAADHMGCDVPRHNKNDPSLTISNERSARVPRERASEDSIPDLKSEVKQPVAKFEITSSDPQWQHWLVFLRNRGREDLEQRAVAAGTITAVGSRWPKEDCPLPHIKRAAGLTEASKRITGGA